MTWEKRSSYMLPEKTPIAWFKLLFLYVKWVYNGRLLGIWYYNDEHNILRHFYTIPNFLFTTSEAKRDY